MTTIMLWVVFRKEEPLLHCIKTNIVSKNYIYKKKSENLEKRHGCGGGIGCLGVEKGGGRRDECG